jgi:hypothetical protein
MLEFATGERLTIPTPGLPMSKGSGGVLGISPDDRSILVTIRVRSESDLSMVDNFH